MEKNLIFVTDSYPFDNGETFIENEIVYLAEYFKKIYIFSLNMTGIQTREIPKNCEVFRIDINKYQKKSLLKALPILKDKIYFRDYFKNKFQKRVRNFLLNSKAIEEKILEVIKVKNLSKDSLIGYSYWFHNSAYALGVLKEKNIIGKVISRAHRYDIFLESGSQPLKKEILEKIDKVYSVSYMGEEYLKNLYQSNKILTSYLGTNGGEFLERKSLKNIIIVSCSNITPVKRVELIVEGLSNLKSNKKVKWIHFGDGIEKEKIEKKVLEKLKNIDYELRGHISNQEILKFYKENNIKVFLSTSLSEGLPVSMMEAQSFGIPIIATNVGGVKEIVNEKTGILLSANPQIDEITEALEKIINLDEKEYNNLRKNSYEYWSENFRAEKNYRKFIEENLL